MSKPDPKELHNRLQDFRLRITRNEPVSDDELRAAITDLQAYRAGAHTTLEAAATKKATKAATKKTAAQKKSDARDLLGGLL